MIIDLSKKLNLIQGDCLEVLKQLPDNSIDLTITSPPYDDLRNYNGYSFDFENIAIQLYRVTKKGGVLVWIVNDSTKDGSESGTSFKQAIYFKKIGFNLHDTMIWYRRTLPQNGNRYEPAFEYMFILSKESPAVFIPLKARRLYNDRRKNKNFHRNKEGEFSENEFEQKDNVVLGNVWDIPNRGHPKEAYEHPAIFPAKLVENHLLSWSNPEMLILDPFMGSGTTGEVALKFNRRFIGIEIDESYFKIASKRINEWYKQNRLF